jgi:hypothetical protein
MSMPFSDGRPQQSRDPVDDIVEDANSNANRRYRHANYSDDQLTERLR